MRLRALDLIRKGRAPEGGWGPFPNSPEAFDTAITLLGLSRWPATEAPATSKEVAAFIQGGAKIPRGDSGRGRELARDHASHRLRKLRPTTLNHRLGGSGPFCDGLKTSSKLDGRHLKIFSAPTGLPWDAPLELNSGRV